MEEPERPRFVCSCGNDEFNASGFISASVEITVRDDGTDEMEIVCVDTFNIDADSVDEIHGPFTCTKCKRKYEEIPPPGWPEGEGRPLGWPYIRHKSELSIFGNVGEAS